MDSFYTAIITDQEANKKRARSLYEADTRISDEDSFRYYAFLEQHKDNPFIAQSFESLKQMERRDECEQHGYKNRMLVLMQKETIDQLQRTIAEKNTVIDEQRKQLAVLQPIQGILDENALLKETLSDIARQNAEFESEAKRARQFAEEQIAYAATTFRKESEDRKQKGQNNINEGYAKILVLLKGLYAASKRNASITHVDIQQFTDKFVEYVEQVRLLNETM
jgi:uncharacterized coiled-coil protein SlyX